MRFAAAIFVLVAAVPAEASAFHWPWEVRYPVHRRHHDPVPPPDCEQINNAVKALDAEHLDRALRSSTEIQRETIAKCQTTK